MLHIFSELNLHIAILLIIALGFVLFYEAINGFHDTANAVATVIYTRAMRDKPAVMISGIFNFLGVILGGLSVAYAVVHLLPTDLLLNISSVHGLVMVFAILLAAIIWNLGTWYFGIPASSSHTLIGAIIGAALINAGMNHTSLIHALNIHTTITVFAALIISPFVGLILAGSLMYVLHRFWNKTKKQRRIHMTPAEREKKDGKKKPPFWIRIMLILSAIGVSFSHGANDGQKGIGVLMLVLMGVAPAGFMVNMNASPYDISRTYDAITHLEQFYQHNPKVLTQIHIEQPTRNEVTKDEHYCHDTLKTLSSVQSLLKNVNSYDQLNVTQRNQTRRALLCISDTANQVAKLPTINHKQQEEILSLRKDLLHTVEYAPLFVIISVALAISIGTMIGWRRVAVTIGEKIGKKGMTYAQGFSAQVTSAFSIGLASYTGMPVSTTHVLSSAIAGTMLVSGGGLQSKTVKNILIAWILTFPAAMLLSAGIYWVLFQFI